MATNHSHVPERTGDWWMKVEAVLAICSLIIAIVFSALVNKIYNEDTPWLVLAIAIFVAVSLALRRDQQIIEHYFHTAPHRLPGDTTFLFEFLLFVVACLIAAVIRWLFGTFVPYWIPVVLIWAILSYFIGPGPEEGPFGI